MEISAIIKEFEKHLVVSGYAKSTITCYLQYLSYFTKYLSEQNIESVKTVNSITIKEYQLLVADMGLSESTVVLRMRPIKRLFSWLVENHRLLIDPSDAMKNPRGKSNKLPPVLTIEEVKLLLEQPNLDLHSQFRDRTIMETLYSSGIRLNELVNLEICDLNLKERELIIRNGKGGHQRVVPIGKRASEYIQKYILKIRPQYSKKNVSGSKIFLTEVGKAVSGNTVRSALYRYKKGAGITKPTSPHSFRRSCATHLLQQGADIRYVQQLLGHKRLRITQIYTRVYPTDLKKIHEETHPKL